jgi:hypothetical protein
MKAKEEPLGLSVTAPVASRMARRGVVKYARGAHRAGLLRNNIAFSFQLSCLPTADILTNPRRVSADRHRFLLYEDASFPLHI